MRSWLLANLSTREMSELGCNCGSKGRDNFQVVLTTEGTEKVVFQSTAKATADSVSQRYPGSVVRHIPAAQ